MYYVGIRCVLRVALFTGTKGSSEAATAVEWWANDWCRRMVPAGGKAQKIVVRLRVPSITVSRGNSAQETKFPALAMRLTVAGAIMVVFGKKRPVCVRSRMKAVATRKRSLSRFVERSATGAMSGRPSGAGHICTTDQ